MLASLVPRASQWTVYYSMSKGISISRCCRFAYHHCPHCTTHRIDMQDWQLHNAWQLSIVSSFPSTASSPRTDLYATPLVLRNRVYSDNTPSSTRPISNSRITRAKQGNNNTAAKSEVLTDFSRLMGFDKQSWTTLEIDEGNMILRES